MQSTSVLMCFAAAAFIAGYHRVDDLRTEAHCLLQIPR